MKFDKYKLYKKSVQSPENDVVFFKETYKKNFDKEAKVLREDFCGTFGICCEWAKLDPSHKSIGIDLSEEPIQYGFQNYFSKLTEKQQKQVEVFQLNVLSPELPPSDIVAALNFSYFIFKERKVLKEYFQNVYNTISEAGMFIVDCFGGPATHESNEEETEYGSYSYFWDQDSYNPITNEAQFYIHFKVKGDKKTKKVFSYDWRMWSLPEVQDIMTEVGFKDVHVMWEGNDEDGDGNGVFTRQTQGEECEAWVAYVVGKK